MSDMDAIKALDRTLAEGLNAADAGKIAAQYTQDATILPPGAASISGVTAIQAYWQAGIDAGLTDATITPSSVEVLGETSVTVGTVTGRAGDTALTGKYIVIAKKTAKGWKIHQDIWNFDA
jgi:uncharacterized protein (TIGR02246 family)